MMKIGVLDSGYKSYALEEKILKENGYMLEIFRDHYGKTTDKIQFSRDKTGLFIRQTEIDKVFLDQCPELKAIVRYGIGYDNINLEEAAMHRVKVANVQGYATQSVSDHALALMFSCLRALPEGQRDITRRFGKPPIDDIFELSDKTLGVIGLGRIGTCFTSKCRTIFNRIIAFDPYVHNSQFRNAGAIRSSLNELLSESHVISLHCSLTEETHHLINRETIFLMKKRPILINTARGPVINEKELQLALNEDRIHSAGIDVWEDEPLTNRQKPIVNHPRVISTGHYAWFSNRSSLELQKKAAENMMGLLLGRNVPDRLI
jgi:D-3-phosphoglycerate dehydrogenase